LVRIRRSAIIGRCARVGAALVVVGGAALAAAVTAPPSVGATTAGPTWAGITAAVPANAQPNTEAAIDGVSCPAAGSCVAVGSYTSGGNTVLFADTLTNGVWSTSQLPNPANDAKTDTFFRAISCPAVGSCVATGQYENTPSSDLVGFASVLSGGTWSTTALPLPPAFSDPNINVEPFGLSCPAPGWCIQIGQFRDTSDFAQGFIDTLSGGSWTSIVAPLPNGAPADPGLDLFSASCGAVGSCVTAGPYNSSSSNVIDVLAAGTWTPVLAPLPNNAGGVSEVFSVSCPPNSTDCVGVGDYQDTSILSQNVAWSINGTSVSATEVPTPPDVTANPQASLNDVSCPVAGWCMAVGQYDSTTFPQTTTEAAVLSGGTWTVQAPPGLTTPADQWGVLDDVSCSWPGSCAATGTIQLQSTNHVVLVNTYTNGVWSGNDAVLPSGGDPTMPSFLDRPSCVAGFCVTGGRYNGFGLPFLETHPNLAGYQEVASDGGLFSFNAPFSGSMGGKPLNAPIVGMAVEPDNGGYYEVASDGGLFAFNATFYGSMGGKPLNEPIVGIAFDSRTGGYYEVASDGGIFAFNAPFQGSMGGKPLDKPIVGIAFDAQTGGYYEVASDGGLFAFNAPFQGSMGGKPLDKPIVGMAVDPVTSGYYEVASDGGLFAFNAPFQGSMGGKPLDQPIVGMDFDYVTGGYYEVASDGGIFAFNAPFQGSMGGKPLNEPVVGLATG
jgi:hypothetical protein